MLRTLIWFMYFWMYLLICAPLSAYANHLEHRGEMERCDRLVERVVQNWARRLLWLAGAKVEVSGQQNLPDRAAVYVGDHQGNFDVPVMLACVGAPRGLIAKAELGRLPLVRVWMRHLHCLFVDRRNPRAGAETLRQGAELLKSGHGLTIFPEGTRSRGGAVGQFQGGAFRIASMAGAPIVPVTIEGTHRLMESNKGMRIRPAEVRVTIHPPVETDGLSREELRALPERVRQIIIGAMEETA